MKGALDVVLRHCHTLPNGCVLTVADKEHFESIGRELGHKGLRGVYTSSVLTNVYILTYVCGYMQWLQWHPDWI